MVICDADGAELSNGYGGSMEVRCLGDGYTLVNSLPLERYLQDVVPSEMPASYEPEALKAQAVCARSYACIQLLRGDLAEYGAHIDDSTAYQVYNRVTDADAAREAVIATQGEVLSYQGNIVEAYYFSTSMGYTAELCVECGKSGGIRLSDTGVSPYGWKDAGSLRGGGVSCLYSESRRWIRQ